MMKSKQFTKNNEEPEIQKPHLNMFQIPIYRVD